MPLRAGRWLTALCLATAPGALAASEVLVEGTLGAAIDDVAARAAGAGFSGVVLAEVGGRTRLSKGYGLADAATGRANTPGTLFEIASLSKQFTAAAVLALEEAGRLSTEDRVGDHLPGVPAAYGEVTLYQALTHTGGLPAGGAGHGVDLAAAVEAHLREPPLFVPGEGRRYSNVGYALLAGVVERVSGKPFTEYVTERLFQRAGLEATTFCGQPPPEAPLAWGVSRHGGEPRNPLVDPYPPHDAFGYEYRGMGGVVTSAPDLRRWMHALRTDRVLGAASRRKLFAPASPGGYACGWEVFAFPDGQQCIGHGGAVRGYTSKLWWFPDDDALLIVLANHDGFDYSLLNKLRAAMFPAKRSEKEASASRDQR